MAKQSAPAWRWIAISVPVILAVFGFVNFMMQSQASLGSTVDIVEVQTEANTSKIAEHEDRIRETEQFQAATGATLDAMRQEQKRQSTDIRFIRKVLERRSVP